MGDALSVGQPQLLARSPCTGQQQLRTSYKIELEGEAKEAAIDEELIFTVTVERDERLC